MPKTRVLYLTINPNRQSTNVPTEGWFKTLKAKGLEPVLVSNELGGFHKYCIKEGVPSYYINLTEPSFNNIRGGSIALVKLIWLVIKYRIQIIHCNEQNTYPIGKFLSLVCCLPIVVSIHFRMGRDFCSWAFKWKKPNRIFFTSQANMEMCRQAVSGIIPEGAWLTLKNGIDLKEFKPDKDLGLKFREQYGLENLKLIGTACALRSRKQLEYLFEAAAKLDLNDSKVIIAGGSIKEEEKYADKLILDAKDKLGDKILFLGHLDDLRGFLNALDLFINTSAEEACSLSVLQAISTGCPVVGYSSAETVSEQILPNAGEIVEQNNIQALSTAIQKWLSNPSLIKTAKIAARLKAEEEYEIVKQSEILFQEYRKILNQL